MSDNQEFNHPSYVMVGFYRQTGGPRTLFGSPLKDHASTVVLKVSKGTRTHKDGMDWYFGGLSGDIMEIEFSPAQFAALLTTMNVGSGVPATMRRHMKKDVEYPPDVQTEAEIVEDGFSGRMDNWATKLRVEQDAISALLDKGTISKKDREQIRSHLRALMQEVESNLPFAVRSFREATTKITGAAKAEVDAFVTTMTQSLGLESLKKRLVGSKSDPELGSGEE